MSTLLRVPALWAGAMAHLQIDEGAWSRAIAALTWLLLSGASLCGSVRQHLGGSARSGCSYVRYLFPLRNRLRVARAASGIGETLLCRVRRVLGCRALGVTREQTPALGSDYWSPSC